MIPADSKKREGALSVFADPSLHAILLNSTVPLTAGVDTGNDRRSEAADFRFDFRDQKLAMLIRAPRLKCAVAADAI